MKRNKFRPLGICIRRLIQDRVQKMLLNSVVFELQTEEAARGINMTGGETVPDRGECVQKPQAGRAKHMQR